MTAYAVPDPYERAHLRRIHPELPHGRPGPLAEPSLVRRLTTADAPEEVETALLALSEALARARGAAPVPLVPVPPVPPPPAPPAREGEEAGLRLVAGGVRAAPRAGGRSGAPAGPPPGAGSAPRAPLGAGAPSGRALSSLRRLLRKGRQLSAG